MRRTATPVLVATAVVIILGALFGDNSRAALFAAKQTAVAPGARAEASHEKLTQNRMVVSVIAPITSVNGGSPFCFA